MARVSTTASLGIKKSLGHKKGFNQYDSASPHHSFTIEREVDNDISDELLEELVKRLHNQARKLVEAEINKDLQDIAKVD